MDGDLEFLGDSDCIASAGYDIEEQTLTIEFTDNSSYEFYGVHPFVWFNLQRVTSKGWFFNKNIRNRYSYERVG